MKLDNLVTQDLANEGVWTEVYLYGKPADFDLLVLGDDSDVVQQYGRKSLKKLKAVINKSSKNNDTEFDDETVDDLVDSNDEAVIVRIAGIRGWMVERKGSKVISKEPAKEIEIKGRLLTNDKESYRYLIEKIPELKGFVLKVARDRTNFLSKPSGN